MKTLRTPRYVAAYIDTATVSRCTGRPRLLDDNEMPNCVRAWLIRHVGHPTGAYMGEYLYFDVSDLSRE